MPARTLCNETPLSRHRTCRYVDRSDPRPRRRDVRLGVATISSKVSSATRAYSQFVSVGRGRFHDCWAKHPFRQIYENGDPPGTAALTHSETLRSIPMPAPSGTFE